MLALSSLRGHLGIHPTELETGTNVGDAVMAIQSKDRMPNSSQELGYDNSLIRYLFHKGFLNTCCARNRASCCGYKDE